MHLNHLTSFHPLFTRIALIPGWKWTHNHSNTFSDLQIRFLAITWSAASYFSTAAFHYISLN
uniref:Uncharacterized protein n=1 Tax=Rhizophora mucronata TaxID=61149 RepID=A0A2P2QIB9_RHIMU